MNRRDRRTQALLKAGRRLPAVEAELAAARREPLEAQANEALENLRLENSRLEAMVLESEAHRQLLIDRIDEDAGEIARLRERLADRDAVIALCSEETRQLRERIRLAEAEVDRLLRALQSAKARAAQAQAIVANAEEEMKRLRPLAAEDTAKLRRRLRERGEELEEAHREIRRLRREDQTSARSAV